MSPISIRTAIGFLGRQYHYRTISDHDLLRKALDTEFALRKWRTAYPADPWLAPTFFHLEQLYQAVQTDEARKHATAMLKYVAQHYPNTKEGHASRSRLAAGFPPLIAETPLVAPSPAPSTGSPLPIDSATPTIDATTPAPSASPTSPSAAPLTPAPTAGPIMPTPSASPQSSDWRASYNSRSPEHLKAWRPSAFPESLDAAWRHFRRDRRIEMIASMPVIEVRTGA